MQPDYWCGEWKALPSEYQRSVVKRTGELLYRIKQKIHDRQGAESPAEKCMRNFGTVLTLSINMTSVSHYTKVELFQRFYQRLS